MMEIVYNQDGSACNCNFQWVVMQDGYSIFGAETKEECQAYIDRYL
jgi:hypothetical protein